MDVHAVSKAKEHTMNSTILRYTSELHIIEAAATGKLRISVPNCSMIPNGKHWPSRGKKLVGVCEHQLKQLRQHLEFGRLLVVVGARELLQESQTPQRGFVRKRRWW